MNNRKIRSLLLSMFLLLCFSGRGQSFFNQSPQLSICENTVSSTVDSLLSVNFSPSSNDMLTWDVITLPSHGAISATTYSVSVSPSGTGTETPTAFSYTPTSSYTGPDTFIVRIASSTDTDYATVSVSVNPTPTINGATNVCVANTITLSATPSPGTWSSSNTTAGTVGLNSGIVTGNSGGTTIITYTSQASCTATKQVTVNATQIVSGATNVCVANTITLSATPSPGTWSSSNTTAGTVGLNNGIVTGNSGGTTIITYTSQASCTATKQITVNATPVISGTTNVCVFNTITLSATPSPGTWSSSSTAGSVDLNSGIVTGNSGGTATITYTSQESCVATKQISVNPNPENITGKDTVCQGLTTTLNDVTPGGIWSSAIQSVAETVTPVNGNSDVILGIGAGVATISYTVVSTGCIATKNITVNANPAVITGSNNVCQRLSTTLADATANGTWGSMQMAIATVDPSSGIVTGGQTGTATITYKLTTGCLDSFHITVKPVPLVTITGHVLSADTSVYCNNDSVNAFLFQSSVAGSSFNYYTTGDPIFKPSGIYNYSSGTSDYFPSFRTVNTGTTDTTYLIVKATVNGCTSDMDTIHMLNVYPSPSMTITNLNQVVCNGDSTMAVSFSGNSYNYTWERADKDSSNILGLLPAYSGTVLPSYPASISDVYPNPIIDSILVTPQISGCSGNKMWVTVTINPTPHLSSTRDTFVCDSLHFSYMPTSLTTTGSLTYSWVRNVTPGIANPATSSSNGQIDEYLDNTTIAPDTAQYAYLLTYDFAGKTCLNQQTVNVTVYPTPHLVTWDSTVCNGLPLTFPLRDSTSTATTFQWYYTAAVDSITNTAAIPGLQTGSIIDTLHNSAVNTNMAVDYTVVLTTAKSCTDTGHVSVTVKPTPAILNPVSPSGLCDSSTFTFMDTLSFALDSVRWTRLPNTSLSTANPSTGSGNISSDTLVNTSAAPINVQYAYRLYTSYNTSAGAQVCPATPDTISVTIYPTPRLSRVLDTAVCDGILFHRIPSSATTGTSFAWSRPGVTGISNPAASGNNDPAETLHNPTAQPVSTAYLFTLTTANGCQHRQYATVTVNPTPHLRDTTMSFCSQTSPDFHASKLSYTGSGVQYAWAVKLDSLDPRIDLGNLGASGNTDSITNIISSQYAKDSINIYYTYILNHRGCIHSDRVMLTVNPSPEPPKISPQSISVCKGTNSMNFYILNPKKMISLDSVTYKWQSLPDGYADISVSSSDSGQHALISFPKQDSVSIYTSAYMSRYKQCASHGISNITVSTTQSAEGPWNVYYNETSKTFVCLNNRVDTFLTKDSTSYQWGWEDKLTLAPSEITGEINQSYTFSDPQRSDPDFANRNYWVKTRSQGCEQKSYYIPGKSPQHPAAKPAITLKVYPNPGHSRVTIELSDPDLTGATYDIFDVINARKVLGGTMTGNSAETTVDNLATGNYIIVCYRNGARIASTQFIKQ